MGQSMWLGGLRRPVRPFRGRLPDPQRYRRSNAVAGPAFALGPREVSEGGIN